MVQKLKTAQFSAIQIIKPFPLLQRSHFKDSNFIEIRTIKYTSYLKIYSQKYSDKQKISLQKYKKYREICFKKETNEKYFVSIPRAWA
ncbi:hypothetical protein CDG55_10580 [Acinetobacter sp. WCHA45]|nr:hypothetical protein CDG55_10580 [Acinetobacter sp. WCHA45]